MTHKAVNTTSLFIHTIQFRRLPLALILIIGTALSFALFFLVQNYRLARAQAELAKHANTFSATFESELTSNLREVHSLGALYDASDAVARDEFRSFAKHILEQHQEEFQVLEWLPRVPITARQTFEAAIRSEGFQTYQITERTASGMFVMAPPYEEHFPVTYVEPYAGNEAVLGFDMATDPIRWDAMQKARDTGTVALTSPVTLVQDTDQQLGILAFYPIYRRHAPHDTLAERRSNLAGFALVALRLTPLMDELRHRIAAFNLDMSLHDETTESAPMLLYASAATLSEAQWDVLLEITDRRWRLRFYQSPDGLNTALQQNSGAWWTLIIGLLLTGLVAAYFYSAANYTAKLTAAQGQLQLLTRAVESSMSGVIITDATMPDTPVIYVNPTFEQITGYSAAEVIGRNCRFLQGNDRDQPAARELQQALKAAQSCRVVLRNYRKNGTQFWNELRISPLFDKTNKLTHFVGIATDITDFIRIQTIIQEREQNFHQLFANNPLPMWVYDRETLAFLDVNEAAIVKYGYSRAEFLAMTIKDIRPPEDLDLLLADLSRERAGYQRSASWRHQLKSGGLIEVEITSHTLEFAGRAAVLVVASDVTERKRAEAALQRSAKRLQGMHTIDMAILQAQSSEETAEAALRHLRELIPCERASVATLAADKPAYGTLLAVSTEGDTHLLPGQPVKLDNTSRTGFLEGKFHYIPELETDTSYGKRAELLAEGFHSVLSLPLIAHGELIGSLNLSAKQADFFTEEYMTIGEEVARQLAITLRQTQLFEELLQQNTFLEQRVQERTAELARAKERVEAILDSSVDAILLAYSDIGIQQINSAFCILFECQASDYLGLTLSSLIHPGFVEQWQKTYDAVAEARLVQRLEIRAQRKDGTTFEAAIGIAPVSGFNDEATGVVCVIQDITERKQIAAELERQRLFLRNVIDVSPNMIFVKDYDGRFVLVNPMTARIYNTTVDALIGKKDADFNSSKEEVDSYLAADRQVITSGEPLCLEEPITGSSGETRWLQTTKVPIVSADGNSKYVLGISIDITERIHAEAALKESEEKYRSLVETMRGGLVVFDLNDRITYINDRFCELLGYSREEVLGTRAVDYIDPGHMPRLIAQLQRRQHLESSTYELLFRHKDGRPIYLLVSGSPLLGKNGQHIGSFAVTTDITAQKQAEEALQQALGKEKELNELKSRFVSMASHEFRTPLATIQALTETLSAYRHRMTDDQIEQRLNKIKDQVSNLKDIMDDVLQLARLQARRADFNPVRINLNSLCRSVLDEFQDRPNSTQPVLYTCNDPLREVKLDKKLMRQIIRNLVSNAVKYSLEGKTITVSLTYTNDTIILQVSDEGIGIPEDDLNHLFEAFHRAANVGTISGTGLGLVITKESAELHGGTITVASQVGVGTTFTVSIPVVSDGG
jgi:PAS domain S-box-containing protein